MFIAIKRVNNIIFSLFSFLLQKFLGFLLGMTKGLCRNLRHIPFRI
nr:MAG TPA: hypothetical protein [Caudoviricetes sp.]